MAQSINSKNEHVTGSATFKDISKKNQKHFDIIGTDDDQQVTLDALVKANDDVKGNPNIDYFGYGGTDTLIYSGNTKPVTLEVLDGDSVFIQGGYKKGSSKSFSSLDVTAHNVEIFDLTEDDDTADFDGLSYGVTVNAGGGDDSLKGTTYIDTFYGEDGDDLIYGYGGNDVLDGGTGADTIYGGEGNDIISSGSLKDQSESDQLWGGSGADMFVIGDGSTDYTSDFTLDISAAFPDDNSDWTTILNAAGSAVSLIPGLKVAGTAAKVVAYGLEAYYAATTSSQTTFTIDADWGETAEAQVKDFNPFEDHILIPIAVTEGDLNTNYFFDWDPLSGSAFTLWDNRGTADRQILSVEWASDLADYVPDYMTQGGLGVTINSEFYDAIKASMKESYVNYDGTSLYFGDELQDMGDWTGEMAGSNLGYMDIGAYSGWTIYDNESDNDMWIGTNQDDILGGFVPIAVNSTSPSKAHLADDVQLYGMGGDDLLFGGAGNDIINGGENLDGTSGSDTVAFFDADSVIVNLGVKTTDTSLGIDYATSNATYTIGTQSDGTILTVEDFDRLYDIENVIGSDGDDIISGDTGENVLAGAGGDDTLAGGGGADTFIFTAASGQDTITDLDADDVLVFQGLTTSERDALISSLSGSDNSLSIDGNNSVTWTGIDKSAFQTSITANEDDAATYDVTIATSETASSSGFINLTDTLDATAATQSSNYVSDNYLAHNVLDGDISTINHTGKNDPAPWLSIDLGQDALIEFIDLENRQDNWTSSRLSGAHIEVWDDGVEVWSSSDLTSAHSQFIDVGGIVGDEVRIDHANTNYLHIAEIDIYGEFMV